MRIRQFPFISFGYDCMDFSNHLSIDVSRDKEILRWDDSGASNNETML